MNNIRVRFSHWRQYFKRETRLRFLSYARKTRRLFSKSQQPAILIGPNNSANQGTEWSTVLNSHGAKSDSLKISADSAAQKFPTDIALSRTEWLPIERRQKLAEFVATEKDIVLIESLSTLFSLHTKRVEKRPILEDLTLLRRMGKRIGIVFHGSDIRDTDAHAARISFSTFGKKADEIRALSERSAENRELLPDLRRRKIPIFVTTLDLFYEVPDAIWLPVAIDFPKFEAVALSSPVYKDPHQKLRVLFLPSRGWIKSADLIEPVLRKLDAEGIITYVGKKEETEFFPHDQIPDLLGSVDVVIDQFLGVIGVFAIEALAAERIVLSYLPEELHKYGEVPIVNITPDSLEGELRRVAAERPLPHGGVEFARKWHDGRESARVIADTFRFKLK